MDEHLRSTLTQLWEFAGLGPLGTGLPELEFDDVILHFAASEDQEEVIIYTDCGNLEDFGAQHLQRLQTLLQLGFALLYDHDALLHLEDKTVRVSARYRYETNDVRALASLLSDVAAAAQTVARLAHERPRARISSQEIIHSDQEPAIIFQP